VALSKQSCCVVTSGLSVNFSAYHSSCLHLAVPKLWRCGNLTSVWLAYLLQCRSNGGGLYWYYTPKIWPSKLVVEWQWHQNGF